MASSTPFVVYFIMLHHLVLTPSVYGKRANNALIVTDFQSSSEDEDVAVIDEEEAVHSDIFQPTSDWKPIEPGQSIPKGLHVRINMATGLKEARLIREERDADSRENIHQQTFPQPGQRRFSPQELKEALKAIKAEDIVNVKPKESKAKFRSLEELKKEFSDLKINVQTETDILSDLLERYKACRSEDERTKILEDLEYIVHQFDVARDFVRLDGLQLVLPDLNSSSVAVRSMVCATLGAAMQGNPLVQIGVLEQNGLSVFIRLVLLDLSRTVRARALFAMSCLLRNFPYAQQRFLENGGVQLMASVLREPETADPAVLKVKLKVVTLVNDLLVEQEDAVSQLSSGKRTSKMYLDFPLRKQLVDHGFCDLLGELVSVPDQDVLERVVPAMRRLTPDCTFDKHLPTMRRLAKEVQKQTEQDESDEEMKYLLQNIKELLDAVKQKDEL